MSKSGEVNMSSFLDRRRALAKLGLGMAAVYAAPVVLKLSEARAVEVDGRGEASGGEASGGEASGGEASGGRGSGPSGDHGDNGDRGGSGPSAKN